MNAAPPQVIKHPDPPASVTMAAPAQPIATDRPFEGRPRSRYYLMQTNANCPEDGAFNGVCKVYFNKEQGTGDKFFYLSQPYRRIVSGKIVLENERPPSWADVVDEYPVPTAPRPFARVPGSSPVVPGAPVQNLAASIQKS